MLADTTGEDDGIHAAHGCDVAADQLLDLVVQHIGSQLRALVAGSSCLFDITLVAGNTGDAQQTGLLVQDLVQLVASDVQVVLQVVDHRGVDIAAAGTHHQASQRGHAHGGINDLALVNRGNGRTIAQVAGDELQTLNGLLQILGSLISNVFVAGAVEAIAADAVLLIVLVGDGVHIGFRGHGAVESGVEDSDHGDVRAKDLAGSLNAQDACGVVQGGQGAQLTDGLDDLVGDQAALLELLTAVDNTVADGVDLAHIVDALALAGGHLLHDLSKSLGVGGEDGRGGSLFAVGLVGDHAALHANALAQALAEHFLAVHIDELILQGRRTAVNNQNFHLL
ncbi:cAMP-binding protein [Faecalibacterium sp. CAG:82]|nr:cAMP-binding protein [Faecalibacterium sp. CAG:82]